LFVNDALLNRMQRSIGGSQAFDRQDLFVAHCVSDRARIVRHIINEDRARTAFRAITSQLGAVQTQLVAQGPRQSFLPHYIDSPLLAVDSYRNEPLSYGGNWRLAQQS